MSHMSMSRASAHQALDVSVVDRQSLVNESSKDIPITNGNAIYYLCKRMIDTSIVMMSLPFLVPLMILIAVCIKLGSPGPVFFRQKRVGARQSVQNGKRIWEIKPFEIFKFRSMHVNADEPVHHQHVRAWINGELEKKSDSKAKTKLNNDARITRVGHFLRKTSIDEAPQVINILLGQMSLVGPRPVPEYEVAEYQLEHYERLHSLPGLTGLWQVVGRGNVSFEEMMALDIKYVRKRSIWQDIKIIALTVPAILSGSGAE